MLKTVILRTWNSFNAKFWPRWKDRKNSYQVRQILALSCKVIALILVYNNMKDLRVSNIFKEIKLEEVSSKLKSEKSFQRQSFTKYLRLTLVFMWNREQWKSLISIFEEFFTSFNKIFILAGRLHTRLSFYEV